MTPKITINKKVGLFVFVVYLATEQWPKKNVKFLLPLKFQGMRRKLFNQPFFAEFLSIIRKYTNRHKKVKPSYLDILFCQHPEGINLITKRIFTDKEYKTFWQFLHLIDQKYFTQFWSTYQQKISGLGQQAKQFSLNQKIVRDLKHFFNIPKTNWQDIQIYLIPWCIKDNFFGKIPNSNTIIVTFPLNKLINQKNWTTWERVFYHELIHARCITPQIRKMFKKIKLNYPKNTKGHSMSVNYCHRLLEEKITASLFPNGILAQKYYQIKASKILPFNKLLKKEMESYFQQQKPLDFHLLSLIKK